MATVIELNYKEHCKIPEHMLRYHNGPRTGEQLKVDWWGQQNRYDPDYLLPSSFKVDNVYVNLAHPQTPRNKQKDRKMMLCIKASRLHFLEIQDGVQGHIFTSK